MNTNTNEIKTFDNLMAHLPNGIRQTFASAVPNTLRRFGKNVFRARWIGGTIPEIKAIEENPDIEVTVKRELTHKSDGAVGLEMLFKLRTL